MVAKIPQSLIGRAGHIALDDLAMITAGHAVMVHGGEIFRHGEAGLQLQPVIALRQLARSRGQGPRPDAASPSALPAGAALIVPGAARSGLEGRVFQKRFPDIVAGFEAVTGFRRDALLESGLHAPAGRARPDAGHMGEEVEALRLVMGDLREDIVLADKA